MTDGGISSLIGKDSVSGVVYLGVHVTDFSAVELGGLEVFKRNGLRFSGSDIFPALIEVALGGFYGFGKVFLDVVNGEQRPPYQVAGLDGLDPSGLDRVTAHGVHQFDGLLGGWQVVNTVGLS